MLFSKIRWFQKIALLKKYLFWGKSFIEKVNVWCCVGLPVSKVGLLSLFWKSSSSKKVASIKKIPFLFSQEIARCLVEVLLWKSSYLKKITAEKSKLLWKSSCSKKVTVLEKQQLPKITVLSSQLPRRSGCSEEVLTVSKKSLWNCNCLQRVIRLREQASQFF